MVGESWNVFTIRVLVEKRISGPRPSLALFCRRPRSACKNTALIQKKKLNAIPIAEYCMFLIFTFVPSSIVK